MSKRAFIILAVAVGALWPSFASAQNIDDLKGIWVGQMVAGPSSQEAWLFLGADEKGVKGTFTSNMNTANEDAALENVAFKDGVLTCEYVDRSPAARGRVFLELRLAQGWLVGTFRDSSGGSGTLQVNRRINPAETPKPEEPFLGTWTGEMVSGKTRTQARLVLDEGGNGPVGWITPDVEGVDFTEVQLDHLVYKDDTLTCDFTAIDARTFKPVLVTLELKMTDAGTLEGTFRDASGKRGTITLTKSLDAPSGLR